MARARGDGKICPKSNIGHNEKTNHGIRSCLSHNLLFFNPLQTKKRHTGSTYGH